MLPAPPSCEGLRSGRLCARSDGGFQPSDGGFEDLRVKQKLARGMRFNKGWSCKKQGELQQNQGTLQKQGKLQKHLNPGSAVPAPWCSGGRSDDREQAPTLTKPVNWAHPRVKLACLQAKLARGRTPK